MSNRATILFVDDEPHIVATLKSLFRAKYDVHTATSGAEALEIVKRVPVHVIVSDQRMPEMAGIDLLRQVKEIAPSTMRILLTGYADFAAIVGSVNSGEVYRYIYKPWNNKEIQETVQAAATVALEIAADINAVSSEASPQTDSERPSILVLDEDPNVRGAVEKLFGDRCRIFGATTCSEALDIFEHEVIAVVVSDVYVARQDVTPFIKVLKAQRPEIVTVVLTRFNDATMVVNLINQGQIYRYLGKPMHQAQLRVSIESALVYHAKCKRQPRLLSRHRVERVEDNASTGFATAILSRLRSLRGISATAR